MVNNLDNQDNNDPNSSNDTNSTNDLNSSNNPNSTKETNWSSNPNNSTENTGATIKPKSKGPSHKSPETVYKDDLNGLSLEELKKRRAKVNKNHSIAGDRDDYLREDQWGEYLVKIDSKLKELGWSSED